MIHLPELDAFTKRFAQCNYEPLRITIRLLPNSRLVSYDPIHLDGLLARAVVELATRGRLLADSEEGYWIPLPLKMLWQSSDGYPLWAATVLYPVAPNVGDIYVRHKRNSGGWLHNKPKLTTRNGPWMERRLPTPITVCDTWEARCVGNLDAVKNLLDVFTHIGKLRLGRVRSVTVEPFNYTDDDILHDGTKLLRPIPAQSALIALVERPSLIGWTPPFWKPSLFRLGWRVNTVFEKEVDYFGTVDQL
jgi:hypothetical protein